MRTGQVGRRIDIGERFQLQPAAGAVHRPDELGGGIGRAVLRACPGVLRQVDIATEQPESTVQCTPDDQPGLDRRKPLRGTLKGFRDDLRGIGANQDRAAVALSQGPVDVPMRSPRQPVPCRT